MALLQRARSGAPRNGRRHQGRRFVSSVIVVALLATGLASALVTTVFTAPAEAAGCTKTWAGTGTSANWFVAGNWSPNGVPGATDDVCGGSTPTDIVIDGNVTIKSWNFSAFIIDITITTNATVTLTSTTSGSRFHSIIGQSGRIRANHTEETLIGSLKVLPGDDFTVEGSGPINVAGGDILGTLRVGTPGAGSNARAAHVGMALATRIPGDIIVAGPTATDLTLTGSTPNTGLGSGFGTTGHITNGANGRTTLAHDARLVVKPNQHLTVTGPFTVEQTTESGGSIETQNPGGVLTVDAGFTNLNGGALDDGTYILGGTIELPAALTTIVGGTSVIYRGGNFTTGGNATKPSTNDGILKIESSTTFSGLTGIGQLVVGTNAAGNNPPVTFTVNGPGLHNRGFTVVNQTHTLACAVACTLVEHQILLNGNITGSFTLDDDPNSCCIANRIEVGGFNFTKPRGHVDDLHLSPSTITQFDLADFDRQHPSFLDATDITVDGKLHLLLASQTLGTRTLTLGEEFPIVRSVNPIVGSFDDVAVIGGPGLANDLAIKLISTPTSITARVINRPTLTFTPPTVAYEEGSGSDRTVQVAATISEPFGYPVRVAFITSGSSTAGLNSDYRLPGGQFIDFPADGTDGSVAIELIGDAVDELDEVIVLQPNSIFVPASSPAGTVTILNDDGSKPVLSISNASKVEGNAFNSTANVTVTRAGSTTATSSATFSTANGTATAGSDYNTVSQTVTFGVGETTKTVPVTVQADLVPEADETVKLSLSNATGAAIVTANATLTITNDDGPLPVISVADANVVEGTGGTTNATVTLTRTGSTLGAVTAQVVTSAGTASTPADFTAATTTITFNSGVSSRTLTVPIAPDTAPEDNELVNVVIANISGGTIGQAASVVQILDDDPVISMVSATEEKAEGDSGTSNLSIGLIRSTTFGPASPTVKLSTTNGTATSPGDFTAVTNQTVNFGSNLFAFVNVPIAGDTVAEADETFTATIANPSAGVALGALTTTTATILNDDGEVPALSIADASIVESSVGVPANFSFKVKRTGSADGSITFQATTSAGTATSPADFTAGTSTLTMAPGVSTVNVVVPVIGDTVSEADETFTITLSQPIGATIDDGVATATIQDDDPAITVDTPTVTKAEGDAGVSNAVITLRRSTTLGPATPSVKVSTANGTAQAPGDFTALSNVTVAFAAGSATASVSVSVVGDTTGEGDETFTLSIGTPSTGASIGAQATATVTITNDDGPAYHALSPGRLLDSRDGNGTPQQKWQPGQTRSVQITGQQGVPGSGVSAVVLNVTVTGPSAGSHLRLFPTGTSLPNASSINFDPGQTIANLAMVKLGTGGKIDIFNNSGQVDVLADVVGYYDTGTGGGDRYTSLVPGRLLDSRDGNGTPQQKWQPGQTRSVQITGQQGVPGSGVSAVVLNLTVTAPSAGSHLRVFPTGTSLPNASSINFDAGQTIANGVVAKLGTGGKIDIFNNSGQVDVLADVVGYFSTTGGTYTPLAPGRLLDSRDGNGTPQQKWQPGQTRSVQITGQQGVPGSGVTAVVLNLTVTGPTAGSHLRAFPSGATLPNASSINFDPGQTIANLVVVKVGAGGKIDIFNNSGQVDVLADVVGYFT